MRKHVVHTLIGNPYYYLGLLLSFIIPLVVYIKTLAPTVTFGDSGEFITAAVKLGIPHPPGFPLWTLLAHFFVYLPFNSPAWRINFSSAFFVCLSSTLLYSFMVMTAHYFLKKKQDIVIYATALIFSLIFAFSKTPWSQAVITEVFALGFIAFILQLLFFFKWYETRNTRFACLAFLTVGLSFGIHYLFLILVPVYIVWIGVVAGKKLLSPVSLLFVGCFLAGFLIFLYLPLRAGAVPAINWGNPNSMQRFVDVVTRKQFLQTFEHTDTNVGINIPIVTFSSPIEIFTRGFYSIWTYSLILFHEFGLPLFVVSVFLLFWFFIFFLKHWRFMMLLVLIFAVDGVGYSFAINMRMTNYSLFPWTFVEYSFSFISVFIILFYGAVYCIEKIPRFNKWYVHGIVVILSILPLASLIFHYKGTDVSGYTLAYEHAVKILELVDNNAVIFADKNNWIFPLLYVKEVENIRPDVSIIDRTNNVFPLRYPVSERALKNRTEYEKWRYGKEQELITQLKDRPIYYAADFDFENLHSQIKREGILYTLQEPKQLDFYLTYKNMLSYPDEAWNYPGAVYMTGYYHLQYSRYLYEKGEKEKALKELEKIEKLGSTDVILLTNISVRYAQYGDIESGKRALRRVLYIEPGRPTALGNLKKLEQLGNQTASVSAFPSPTGFMDYVKKGECEKAQDALVGFNQPNASLYNNLGYCWAMRSEPQKAKEVWEKALEIDPSYKPTQDNLNKLEQMMQ